MAELTEPPASTAATTIARRTLDPTVLIAAIYLASRVVTIGFFYIAAALAQPGSRFGPGLSIERFLIGWDGQWYWTVAFAGYPTELPLNEAGQVAENAWAFMPLYPWLSQGVGFLVGSFAGGAAIVTFVCGFFACLAMYRLLRNKLEHTAAIWAVIFFANGPLGALFHVAYAETMFLLFLLLALDALIRRRFVWLYLLIPLMGFTRPGILAFALLLGLYGIHRWFRRHTDPLPAVQIVHIIALGALATVVGFSWQMIAGIVTGDMSSYLETELSWRRNWIPDAAGSFFPFEGWIAGIGFWSRQWGIEPWIGIALFAVLLAAVVWMVWTSRAFRTLGVEMRLWFASYALYLLAVFFPQSSTLRLLLPLSPAWGAVPVAVRSPVWRSVVLAGCLAYQLAWILAMYAYGMSITQIP